MFGDRKLPLEQFSGLKTVFEIEQNHFPMFGLENTYAGLLFTARLLFENSYL